MKSATDIDLDFLAFHSTNPIVYDVLCRLAREAKQKGKRKLGMKMLWERMRWEMWLLTNDPSGYKLNNNYTSRYARLIMHREHDLAGMFDLRELRS